MKSLVIPERISKLSDKRLLEVFKMNRLSRDRNLDLIKAELLKRGHVKRNTKTGDNINHKTKNKNKNG